MNTVIGEKDCAAHQNYGEYCHLNVGRHTEFVCVHIYLLIRSLNRKHGSNISLSENLFKFRFCYAVDFSMAGKVPAVCVVVKSNLISLIEDDVTWLCRNLRVVSGK